MKKTLLIVYEENASFPDHLSPDFVFSKFPFAHPIRYFLLVCLSFS